MRRFEMFPRELALLGALLAVVSAAACGGREAPIATAPAADHAPPITAPTSAPDPGRDAPGPADRVFSDRADAPAGRWYGVYQGARKVGYAHVVARRARAEEPGRWVAESSMHVEVAGGGDADAVEQKVYAGGAEGRLVAGRYAVVVGGVADERVALFGIDATTVTRTTSGGEPATTRCDPTAETIASALATAPPDPSALTAGATTTHPVWDWEACADDVVEVLVVGVERRRVAGVEAVVAELRARAARTHVTTTRQVLAGGVGLADAVGGAFVMKLEDEATARSGAVGLDILGSGVAVTRALGPAVAVTRLELAVTLPDGATLPSDARQRVTAREDGRVRVVLRRGPGDEVTEEDARAALVADSAFDWGEPTVRAAAAEATAGFGTDRERVAALVSWVGRRLRDRLGSHVPTASAILRVGEGDCTEHAWLFVALARASGIPARPVYGLAYAGDVDRRFAFHAWAEVRLDGRWVAVDPTWDEAEADATHLTLSRDGFERLANVVGGLALEVLDVRAE